jgi:two-component system chemotaxis response regulator CheB
VCPRRIDQTGVVEGVMPYRLLIVDDSPYYRMRFAKIFARSESLRVAGLAEDGDIAIRKILELTPDVILLDLIMERLDGFGVLRWIMENRPLPTVVCSNFSDGDRVFKALDLGAVDFLVKPAPRAIQTTSELEGELITRVEQAATARVGIPDGLSKDARVAVVAAERDAQGAPVDLVCIAASTGGPSALQRLVGNLPRSLSVPIVVVQHMPAGFTGPFAERLNALSHYTVREAQDGEPVRRRYLYVAPAAKDLEIVRHGEAGVIRISEPVSDTFHRPSADAVFESAARVYGSRVLAVVLTGMGEDGARGAEIVRAAGGHVLAESSESAVVFGMPRAVVERGCASATLPLAALPRVLLAYSAKE